ncbi:tyrosine-type recombinase/integrase [Nocardioides sp. QY071]|uniref:tyrosine-type recombinase/integrase n=1 Tax=Nocardioides sp. QY071 TaxID=3044187 RepID=UPI00249BBA96|nr:tyrosine-type recombinase/integrase [Nocardioides sp. QY071]WGY04003.1 tyrosine-type recombinase/integrase [Nocardioides sp. QY071]
MVYEDPKTRRRRTKGGFKSRTTADEWADDFKADVRHRPDWIDTSKATPTFRDVARQWLGSQHFDRAHTANHYRRIIEGSSDLMETFGDVLVGEITTEDVKRYVKTASSRLAAQTVRHRFYVLRFVLDEAVEESMIRVNPARAIRRLRLPNQPKVEDHERRQKQSGRRLTAEQIDSLVAALPEPHDMFIRLLAYSGMRPEEACGLTVEDVTVLSPELAVLHVHQVVVEVNGEVIREEVTKTPESNRVIPLDPETSALLVDYIAAHRKRAAKWFTNHPEHDHPGDALPLFVGSVVGGAHDRSALDRLDYSKPLRYGAFYKRHWHKARKAAGIPDGVRVYDLRHTFASMLMDKASEPGGLTPKEVQTIMGHKDGTMLMKRYWHTRDQDAEVLKAQAAAVAAAFQRRAAPDNVTRLDTKRA